MQTSNRGAEQPKRLPLSAKKVEEGVWFHGSAGTLAGLLTDIGTAFLHEFGPEPDATSAPTPLELFCHANNAQALLVNWLELLLYVLETRQAVLEDLEVHLDKMSLTATCRCLSLLGSHWEIPRALDARSAKVVQTDDGLWEADVQVRLRQAQTELQDAEADL
jgi:SHS2 domain-containing protein